MKFVFSSIALSSFCLLLFFRRSSSDKESEKRKLFAAMKKHKTNKDSVEGNCLILIEFLFFNFDLSSFHFPCCESFLLLTSTHDWLPKRIFLKYSIPWIKLRKHLWQLSLMACSIILLFIIGKRSAMFVQPQSFPSDENCIREMIFILYDARCSTFSWHCWEWKIAWITGD